MSEPGRVGVRVPSPLAEITYASEEDWRAAVEQRRRDGVAVRRSYYDGTRYDAVNQRCLIELQSGGEAGGEKGAVRWWQAGRLPEHLRVHDYCQEIAKSVDFLVNRLTTDFGIVLQSTAAQEVIDRCLDASPELSGSSDDNEYSIVNVTREALLASDCPVRIRFDPAAGTCWCEFWPSDAVRLDFSAERSDKPTYAALWVTHWVAGEDGRSRQITVRREWKNEVYTYPGPDGTKETGTPTLQCVESWWEERPGGEDVLLRRTPTGVPFVPWALLRGCRKTLRTERGESIVTGRAMSTADRYDALEGRSWLAAAHNAHATLAVVGDQALIQLERTGRVHKDIADVLALPGGTGVVPITLPTDPSMIEHQRAVLLDELYGCFGLARVDQSTLAGLGQVTGYALEILNAETDVTFESLRTQCIRDWKSLVNTVLDCHAHWTAGVVADDPGIDPVVTAVVRGLAVDPLVVYPQRGMEVRTGSGGVVDAAQLRDDYVAGVISRREVLRRRGYTDEEITRIEREITEETAARTDVIGGVESGVFGAPTPVGVSGGTSSTPTGEVGGVVNNPGDAGARLAGR